MGQAVLAAKWDQHNIRQVVIILCLIVYIAVYCTTLPTFIRQESFDFHFTSSPETDTHYHHCAWSAIH